MLLLRFSAAARMNLNHTYQFSPLTLDTSTRRNEFGMFTQDAVVGAMRDLDVAISLTGVFPCVCGGDLDGMGFTCLLNLLAPPIAETASGCTDKSNTVLATR